MKNGNNEGKLKEKIRTDQITKKNDPDQDQENTGIYSTNR
jgi:hypothetical protein